MSFIVLEPSYFHHAPIQNPYNYIGFFSPNKIITSSTWVNFGHLHYLNVLFVLWTPVSTTGKSNH